MHYCKYNNDNGSDVTSKESEHDEEHTNISDDSWVWLSF